jgi:4-amino-4-deoxy-L-arabinose transferase-like glycosyltransferase
MFHLLHQRLGHCLLLISAGVFLFLVNLGGPSLWDVDEGRNATAAMEMFESGDWVKPTFNGQLRPHKPVLLYWLQALCYGQFGINEFSARLPSALAALLTLLVVYELGRRMFGAATGLCAGLILASTASFCGAARFANPDALLNLFTALALFLFWQAFTLGTRVWYLLFGASIGCAVLAKGPVGIVLPFAGIGLFLLWARQLRWIIVRRLLLSLVPCLLVALPWFVWVAVETKGQFLRDFFLTHNLDRGLNAMESHGGPVYYYALALVAGFAPWSVFFLFTLRSVLVMARSISHVQCQERDTTSVQPSTSDVPQRYSPPPENGAVPRGSWYAYRFLCSWIIVFLVVFTIAATKLPNYILPLFPALALLTAHALERWRRQELDVPSWLMHASLAGLVLIGAGMTLGILIVGGTIELPIMRGRKLSGLEAGTALGLLPILGAAGAWWCWRQRQRAGALASLCVAAVLLIGAVAIWGGAAFNRFKAPRPLVEQAGAFQRTEEIRIGCYQLEYLPSLNFYTQRDVKHHATEQQAVNFLRAPYAVYLFVPAAHWQKLAAKVSTVHRVAGRHRDLYRNCEVLVVTNR